MRNRVNVLTSPGNTYPFVLFGAYGGFWLSFAATLTPSLGAYGHYSTAYSDAHPSAGLDDPTFAASFGFYLLAMAVLSLIFALGALRLNICLMIVEWGLTVCFGLLTATFWHLAQGNADVAGKCLTVSLPFAVKDFASSTCTTKEISHANILLSRPQVPLALSLRRVLGGSLRRRFWLRFNFPSVSLLAI